MVFLMQNILEHIMKVAAKSKNAPFFQKLHKFNNNILNIKYKYIKNEMSRQLKVPIRSAKAL